MKTLNYFALTLLSALFTVQVASGQVDPEKLPAEVYRYNPDLKLYFAYPEGKQGMGEKLPTIVFFFGGGWTNGSVVAFARQAEYFSQKGMLVVLADYRIKSKHQTTPLDAVQDAKSAMRYVKANAGRLGVDTTRLAAGGGSAGGHLAACTAFSPKVNSPADDLSISPIPKALVLYNPVVIFPHTPERGEGMTENELISISPYHHIFPDAPPTLIMHGTNDTTVPASTVETFDKKMAETGNKCVLKLYEGYGHGFFNYRENNPTAYHLTIKDVEEFLASLGYISR
jgi:acetyl esterase/lipase